jgi:hypothetical protein
MKAWQKTTPVEEEGSAGEDGWVVLRVQFHDEEQARFVAMGLGQSVDVLAPESLRLRVAAELAAAVERLQLRAPTAPV